MDFWVFMLSMNLLMPFIMIVFGGIFIKKPPKEINAIYGYRTTMSKKNKDTWEFAHKYCGRLWYIIGWVLLPVSIIVMMFVLGKDEDIIGRWGSILCIMQCIPLIGTIFLTEKALKDTFDKNGTRKK